MKRILFLAVILAFCGGFAHAGSPPSVFIEELTWTELKDALDAGYTTIIVPTGGTEQNGPHMVLGKHNVIVKHAAGQMAAKLGDALVAPVIAYVPEGSIDPPSGHMKFPGTITLPEEIFVKTVEYAARSFRLHGFRTIALIGDSGGNLNGLDKVERRLNEEWNDTDTRVYFLRDFTRGDAFKSWLMAQGETEQQVGYHAGIMDTSVAMAVDPGMIRLDKMAPGTDFDATGVLGDPSRATAAYGRKGLEIQVEGAVEELRRLLAER